ncbi:glycerophosphoinositol inositolphosphodiesterase GDPD2 [Kryptolebias marmoratus]|uniref:Glycerophosphodiester phosphodiesterase domain containing 2 n=1 Tax=Kryptolebias marmoratus TaxID=37003 RepID=A0A3Q3ENW6_KRYMA|nr:glycerophosphoinositol inositolphosphodiesterase GDPD2 [Kryptolebias marmoratus]
MMQIDSFCRVCSRGFYSCHWRKPSENGKKCACCWFLFVSLVVLLLICWMYICLVTYNDQNDFNTKIFTNLKVWVNWFMLVIVVSAVLTSYCVLLLLFALVQVALREPLVLHWLHKIFLCFGVIIVLCGVAGISCMWRKEWRIVPLSFQATAPFLQFGAVGALTLLSSFVFHAFRMAKKGSKYRIAAVFLAVSAAIFLCPLFIKSPCLIDVKDLPEKPKLIGHRGAPMHAPENTMMSFKKSIECEVMAFETDVQVSKDRTAFLMHDQGNGFLDRTTNIRKKLSNNSSSPNQSSSVTFDFLQSLNAGEWFLETDPFHTVHLLSEEEKETARNQTVPSLLQLLQLAQNRSISVIFDLYSSGGNYSKIVVQTILESKIDHHLVYWLPPEDRSYVKQKASGFIQVYKNESEMEEEGGHHLNMQYSDLNAEKIRELRDRNISVNLWTVNERWLFSLLWCAGASSVTTNNCHLLKDMKQPNWIMAPSDYRTKWILVDISSILLMMCLYFLQWKVPCSCYRPETQNNTSVWREMSSLMQNEA